MDPRTLDGCNLVLVLLDCDEAGKRRPDGHRMRTGKCRWDGEALWLEWGEDHPDPPFPIASSRWDDIRPTPPGEFQDESGASHYLIYNVLPLPKGGESSGEYKLLWRNPDA
jgi:hypothetical protein